MIEIDEVAKSNVKIWGMPPDVHVPIAARDKTAITKYIGTITAIPRVNPEKGFIVTPYPCQPPNPRLPLWKVKESMILHCSKQVWVHVKYTRYRKAYIKACPDENLQGLFLDHIMNRRIAILKRFFYLRINPVLPGVNTSSGTITEVYGLNFQMQNRSQSPFIQYADISALVKMLNLKTGGKFQDGIRDALYLVDEE